MILMKLIFFGILLYVLSLRKADLLDCQISAATQAADVRYETTEIQQIYTKSFLQHLLSVETFKILPEPAC